MKKYLLSAAAVFAFGLTACGNGDTTTPTTPTNPTTPTTPVSDSQAKAQSLVGKWKIEYTDGATWGDEFTLTRVQPDSRITGRWIAVGKGINNLDIHAWWDPHYELYIIGVNPSPFSSGPNDPTTFSSYYVFRSIAPDGTVEGRYTKNPNAFYTSPYRMTGKRTPL